MSKDAQGWANRLTSWSSRSKASRRGGAQMRVEQTPSGLREEYHEDDELNPEIRERFVEDHISRNRFVPDDGVPTSGPLRGNNDIREYFELTKKRVAGGSWLDKTEIPLSSEVLQENLSLSNGAMNLIDVEESIRPHKVQGAYDGNEDYLRTTYEMLREDCVRPLRGAIREIQADPFKDEAEYNNHSIGIYDPVYIRSLVFSPVGIATRVAFSLSRVKKQIRWEQSKRLITGTLVALSPTDDAFQTQCVLAVVAARPTAALKQNPPEIDLFFARPEEQEIDPMRKWIMVECRAAFFEASRHTLLALQQLMREPFPMSKYLVQATKDVKPPSYIQHNPFVDLSSLVSMEEGAEFENVNILEDWPSTSSHSLDKSQGKALKRMLTKELAIVQGPPGTGKTFISVVALQIACDNLRKDDSPIIVTAQTNHALDQLLRHSSKFEPNYIRLGGRSKDKDIKKRTLHEVRCAVPQKSQPGSQKLQAIIAMQKLTRKCQMLLAPLELNKPPLNHELLLSLGLITKTQAESLKMESYSTIGISPDSSPEILMEQWLGKSLVTCTRPIVPDDYGWGYEEDDFEVEQLQELEAEAVAQDDSDPETLHGPVTQLNDNYTGRGGSSLSCVEIQDLLRRIDDLTTIQPVDRAAIYNYFLRETKKQVIAEIRRIGKLYSENVLQRKVGLWEEYVRVLREARIIGCTTTGLSKYRALLSALRPRILLVEEAAETLEAPVTAGCFPSLEHLILVGDHQQLRPHTNVRAFEDEPYYLNLSLFERLVRNEIEFNTLTRQRRMIPEIRQLLYPIYGNTLRDHPSVEDSSNRPPVEGMGGKNTFFFCHEWREERDANMSAFNLQEADMVVGFLEYLVLNGIEPNKITILTFYNGQRKVVMRRLKQRPNLMLHASVVKVVTVDSYQGEENDIVLLSLVRSNLRHAIGFLNSDNRVCVALSRARRGFYMFGNAQLLATESETWGAVVGILYGKKKTGVPAGQSRRLGYFLPLECTNHGNKVWIQDPGDWDLFQGGCYEMCNGVLPCQHRCLNKCHPFDHDRVNCMQKCSKRVEYCGHSCTALCCDPCKCQNCDRRTNGLPLLKPVPNGLGSFRAPPVNSRSTHSSASVLSGSPTGRFPRTEQFFDTTVSSENSRMLIDLDYEAGPKSPDPSIVEPLSYAAAASKDKKKEDKAEESLLD